MTEDTVTRSTPDNPDLKSGTPVRWDLPALRRKFGNYYEFAHIGLTWYAWPHDGHLTRAITALDADGLQARIIADLGIPRPRKPLSGQP